MIASNTFDYQCNLPATEALKINMNTFPSREYANSIVSMNIFPRSKRMKSSSSFDLSELITAARPVEESIAFPTIEWDRDGEDSELDEVRCCNSGDATVEGDDGKAHYSRRRPLCSLGKRGRRSEHTNMVRSISLKTSLASLAGGSTSAALRKTGSCFEFTTPSSEDSFSIFSSGSAYQQTVERTFVLSPLIV